MNNRGETGLLEVRNRANRHSPVFIAAVVGEEVVNYLRLDIDGPKHPQKTLQYYRERGLLRGVKIGRHMRYVRHDLDDFLRRLSERASR